MSGQERAPSFGRLHPLGNSIVQGLDDIRCGDWVDWGNAHFRLCGCEGLVDDNVDVIKPSELGNVLEAQRRKDIGDRERQRQNERVFPNSTHAAALRAAPLTKRLPCGRPHVNSRLAPRFQRAGRPPTRTRFERSRHASEAGYGDTPVNPFFPNLPLARITRRRARVSAWARACRACRRGRDGG